MKKFWLSAICILIVAVMMFSFCACNNNSETFEQQKANMKQYADTNMWFVNGGKTPYKIVVPNGELSNEMSYARDELTRIFAEATGITLACVTDKDKTHDKENRYISLGDTTLFATSGLSVDKISLKRDGAKIITKDRTIFIVGGSDSGVLYGVYDFLNVEFNFETYFTDCYTLNKNVKDIKLKNYDYTDIPDIAYRQKRGLMNPSSSNIDDVMFAYRMRSLDAYGSMTLPVHEGTTKGTQINQTHNSFVYLPKDLYAESNPKFYSTSGAQLCYSAHGDSEQFDLMTTICAQKLEQSLEWYPAEQYPQYIAVQFGQQDDGKMCTCEACNAIKRQYNNAYSSVVILFMNELGRKVNAWMDEPGHEAYKRDLTYMFFAYQETATAPYTADENGNYAIPEGLRSQYGVKVAPFCAMNGFDNAKAFDAEENDVARETYKAWGACYPNGWSWSYGAFFNDYFAFYDCYSFYEDFYTYLIDNNYSFTFAQIHDDQRGADTGFFALASYICCKKSWDSTLSTSELIDNYFDAMYLDAAPVMKRIFETMRLWFAVLDEESAGGKTIRHGNVTGTSTCWTVGFVKSMFDMYDEAYQAIEVYKGDEALYRSLKNHIDMEWLSNAKVAISCFYDAFSAEEFAQIKSKFKSVVQTLGITRIKEFQSIDPFLESL